MTDINNKHKPGFSCTHPQTKEKQNQLQVLHQNIQGFASKVLEIELFLEKHNYDIVCLTEHFHKDPDILINYENYCIASSFNRKSAIHGGSLILIRNNIKFKERKDVVGLSVECCTELSCVELESHVIVCVYRPPIAKNFTKFLEIMEDVLKLVTKTNKHVIVAGDFNIDILEINALSDKFLGLFKSFNLFNIFFEPTRVTPTSAKCIDNVFSDCDPVQKCIINSLQSDHKGQSVIFPFKNHIKTIKIETRRITASRLEKYQNVLIEKLPVHNYNFENPNHVYEDVFNLLSKEFEIIFNLETKEINTKFKFSDWATKGLRISRDRLFELYELKNMTNDVSFSELVKKYSKTFKIACEIAKANFISNKIKSSDNKIKAVWKVINSETGKTKPRENNFSLKTDKGVISLNSDVAQELETFFTNIPLKTTESLRSSPTISYSLLKQNVDVCNSEFKFTHVSPQYILKTFKDIKVKSTEDLWGMSVKVCQSVIEILAPYLADIFNECIDHGIFPDLMKHSKVVPLFKAGDKQDPSNYRPVSILPVLSKVFEKIILNQMLSHFNQNNLLHNQQFGFTKGRCTTDAGVALIKHVFNAWEESKDAIGVFCDLSKAFDCVDHETLLLKLEHYGIRNAALKFLNSYLDNRTQKVQINGAKSLGSRVKIGVPQGSILGPFLFLIYINDLPYMVENLSKIVLFADDTSLIFKVDRHAHNYDEVNNTLGQIHSWFTANNLVLNEKKTKCVLFTLPNVVHSLNNHVVLNNEKLEFTTSTVFLGITLDSSLQWGPHITSLSGRLSSAAYAVRKIREITDIATARLVYFSYFHSIMSYGILLWGRAADIETIFILQKRAIRAIYKLCSRDSLRELFKEINIMTVPCQYIYENIMYVRKNINTFTRNCDRHNRNTRSKNKIDQPKHRLAKVRTSFEGLSIRYYNKIPEDILSLSESKFKSVIKKTLCYKAYYKLDEYINDKEAWSSEIPAQHKKHALIFNTKMGRAWSLQLT